MHYVTPTEDNRHQTEGMLKLGIFSEVTSEVGDIIVATVNADAIARLLKPGGEDLARLIAKDKDLVLADPR